VTLSVISVGSFAVLHNLAGNDKFPAKGRFMRRRDFITLIGGGVAAWPLAARAQQSERIRRIGVLMSFAETDVSGQRSVATFLEALEQIGWMHGRNLQIEYRWGSADHDLIQRQATELVGLNPDVILCAATPAISALKRATRTIPIVFVNVSDPIGSGFIESLTRPSGNITGFSNFEPAMGGKWVELLKEIAPGLRRIALVSNPETSPQARAYVPAIEAATRSLGLQLIAAPVHDGTEIERAIAAIGQEPGGGLVLPSDVFTFTNRELIIRLADQHRVPAVYPFREFAESGGLMSYGVDLVVQFRQAAQYVDRILKGDNPGELPVQGPTNFQLILNIKTAKRQGLGIPDKLLAIADEVIE
jgi:putative ABC transport system substrate-binding protein